MALDLKDQISELKKITWFPVRVDLQALIDCATDYLSDNESKPSCLSISLLGWGTYNRVYRLAFDNDIEIAASVSRSQQDDFNAQAKMSEIETMKFVRESGLYPDIHVPKVHAWDTTFNNPVGAPYVLMDVVPGETLRTIVDSNNLRGLDAMTPTQQLHVVKALAKLQASLCRPVPFSKLGSLVADPAGGAPTVGPMMTLGGTCLGGPYESAEELWRSLLEREMVTAVEEWSGLGDEDLSLMVGTNLTPHTFAELYQLLSSLIPHFKIPASYNSLVLHHPDIALRNILFDMKTLSSDHPIITGVLDWGGAQILPLMLSARYPEDLISNGGYPHTHPRFSLHEHWMTVPFDWTTIGDRQKWPKIYTAGGLLDLEPKLTSVVRQFYLRSYFSACFGEQMHLLHGDRSLPHATVFADAQYYLKFHELFVGGAHSWSLHGRWIRETYWRLRNRESQTTDRERELLIIGPNIYRGSIEGVVTDLTISEELPE